MMKSLLFAVYLALCCCFALANDDNAELQEYLPIARKLYDGKTIEALRMAEDLSERNHFASTLLYLVYSRGYCGQQIDYAKTAMYFDRLYGEYNDSFPGQRFHDEEFRNVWSEMLVPPVGNQRSITLKTWNAQGRTVQQKINLRGEQPLKNCYFEKTRMMGNIAGASIWAVISRSNPDRGVSGQRIRQEAIRYGSIDALYGITHPNFKHFSSGMLEMESNYNDICKAAESGHIPAKIMLASVLLAPENKYKYAPDEAYQLLNSVIKELETYKSTPCKHYLQDLENAQFLLSLLPDPSLSTEKLASQYNAGGDSRKTAAYLKILASRSDHPLCEIYKIIQLPLKEQENAFLQAAERGNPEIIALLLRQKNNQQGYWRLLYLAGKHNIDAKYNPQPNQSFYLQSYVALENSRFQMNQEEYRKALKQLAEVYPDAKTQYLRIFGSADDNSSERFRFEVSNPEAIKVTRENAPAGNFYVLEIQQDSQQNYVDVFIKPGRFIFSVRPHFADGKAFPAPSSSDIWTCIQYPDGNVSTYNGMGANTYGKCPERIRINIEAGNKKSFLEITL